ncbi:type IVB secretion system protein DotA [Legionella jordanis]|nr:type IVB secretion system protein DotA [Legionella jordanis]RMX05144.1 type IV secretion protein DotA [Legionella jordanis]RMX17400.1 type IV secretion protein DotA [Legionella jordanis]HAT8714404.1 type IVB secretion system protein DotA [Legionella jordanis]
MNKIALILLGLLVPTLVLAADNGTTLNFSPPPSDYSVIFLGNIFGIVDGVLHGTGSQIMGTMFGVFNAAVLAIGGIIIMYTLMVSTMNTAHEGQMLGQKWSSIWVPMRSVLGLTLMIPKASGYCVMQIFVMWIVVQGVGAADKVWQAALSYLNRGGAIIQTQMSPTKSLLAGSNNEVATGAEIILSGQVCMLGLQTALNNQRQSYLNLQQNNAGPCAGSPSGPMKDFCENPVPDFLSSVNVVAYENDHKKDSAFTVPMPNLSDKPYSALNGICGSLHWNKFTGADNLSNVSLTKDELKTTQMSRAIGIQQMYIDLSSVAQIMVNNDPLLNNNLAPISGSDGSQKYFSSNAVQQFGVPLTPNSQQICDGNNANTSECSNWGSDPNSTNNSSPLFNGTEVQGAIADYNGILLPALNLLEQDQKGQSAKDARAFIQDANNYGWILAGSYFFNLAQLNSTSMLNPDKTDSGTGLGESIFPTILPAVTSGFASNNTCSPGQSAPNYLCQWMQGDPAPINAVVGLIDGSNVGQERVNFPASKDIAGLNTGGQDVSAAKGAASSTVYGFLHNSMMVQLPGQPGQNPPQFAMKFNINIDLSKFQLPSQDFPCGELKIMFFHMCLGSLMGEVFYNLIIRNIFNFFLNAIAQIINAVIMTFLSVPLLGIAATFRAGVAMIQQPSVNPVIALANMGVNYINFANELWIVLLTVAVTTSLIPLFGLFIFALIAMAFPLLFAWMSVMLSIGFITAYYVPFLPYMIFTFGAIAWLMVVIEAMVAAPIVALGITHPEGHDAFGKGEQAIMILFNVFLRPAMMIIGYIAAIALTYVSVWIINAGFSNAMAFIQGSYTSGGDWSFNSNWNAQNAPNLVDQAGQMNMTQGYTGWAGIYGFFFSLLTYTTMYLIVVQKSFTLITVLPDKVLRWIGGQAESTGQEVAQWGEDVKGQVKGGGDSTSKAAQQIDSQLSAGGQKAVGKVKGLFKKGGPSIGGQGSTGTDSTPSKPDD